MGRMGWSLEALCAISVCVEQTKSLYSTAWKVETKYDQLRPHVLSRC